MTPSPHLRRTLTYLATIAGTQLTGFLLLPIVTRYLGPTPYGEYAVALAIASLAGMFATSWIRNVAFRFYYDAQAAGTTRSFYTSLVLLQALVLAVVVAALAGLAVVLPQPPVGLATVLAASAMLFANDFLALTVAFLRAESRSGRFAASELTAAAVRLAGTWLGLMAGLETAAFLFLAAALASAVGGGVALIGLRPRLTGEARLDTTVMRTVAWRAPGALPFSVGEWLNTLADRLILDLFASRAVVGVYAAGHVLGTQVVGGLVTAVFLMAWPDVLAAWNDGGVGKARAAVRRYVQLFLWLTVGPVVALVVFSDTVVQLLGGAYRDAAAVIPLVALAGWARGLGNCFNRHHELNKRFWVMSVVTLGGAAVNVALNFLLVPTYLAVGAAVATLVSQTLVMVTFFLLRDRALVDIPWGDALAILALVLGAGLLAVPLAGGGLVGLVVFAVTYAVGTVAFGYGSMRRRPL
jgi:O-antigen/teichoic acid export membrane protein